MRDKRKLFFCLICMIITIICEIFLYINLKDDDIEYKKMMKEKLQGVADELKLRNFDSKIDYQKGKLEYERNKENFDYGYICVDYDIKGEIEDISIKLDYSDNLYTDDVFYDAYYIFNLLGINVQDENDFDTDLDKNFSENNTFVLNNNEYNLSIKKIDDKKIEFEIK